jgi:hypothetical protein
VPFAYYFFHHKDNPSTAHRRLLEDFFWRVSLEYPAFGATLQLVDSETRIYAGSMPVDECGCVNEVGATPINGQRHADLHRGLWVKPAQPFRRRRHSVGCTHVRPGWTEAASPFCYSYKLTGIAMDRVFWKRAALTPIRVLLLPTDTFSFCSYGCSLHKLANILNGAQKSYKFDVPVPESKKPGSSQSRIGISLEKRRPLLNDNVRESAAKTTAERRAAVSTAGK